MSSELSASDRQAVTKVVKVLEVSWNDMDAPAYGTPFTEDADYVNVFGEIIHGRTAIVERHVSLFRDYFPNSVTHLHLENARMLGPEVALLHVRTELDAPEGPLTGHYRSLVSIVMTKEGHGHWEIAAFHNTRRPPDEGMHGRDQSARAGDRAKDLDR